MLSYLQTLASSTRYIPEKHVSDQRTTASFLVSLHHLNQNLLPGKSGTSASKDRLEVGAASQLVGVRKVSAGDGTLSNIVGGTTEVDVVGDNVASLVGVTEDDGVLGVDEGGGLDEDLGAETSVDGRVEHALVQVVVDVGGAEAHGRTARVDVGPAVVGVGDGQVAGVLVGVGVGVADEGALPVVVDEGVGEGDPVGGVGDVEETVVVVLADVQVAGEIDVVDPDVGGLVNANGITVVGVDLTDSQVTDDDVGDLAHVDANTSEGSTAASTNDGLVALGPDAARASQVTLDDDDGRALGLSGLGEGGEVGDGGGGSASTTGGAAVGGGEADVASLSDGGALLDLALGGHIGDGRGGGGGGQAGEGSDGGVLHCDGCFGVFKKRGKS